MEKSLKEIISTEIERNLTLRLSYGDRFIGKCDPKVANLLLTSNCDARISALKWVLDNLKFLETENDK